MLDDERQEAIRELVAEWMRRARSDLEVACMTEDQRIAPEILAFHAQQAAEKALKALLVQRQVEFPRTHAIGALLNLCRAAGYERTEALADAVILTRYAVATRYPGEEEPVTRQEAREAAALAERVLAWVEAQLEEAP
ncbi:MAG: HEPN domain-containing protein [Chloroflexi bacterium]|nr:MAG: HEPN domain-containing protein [Chloroflexota bacterium]